MDIYMEYIYIFIFGGIGYGMLEILWRGYTHWTMLITGGICFLLIYVISIAFSFMPVIIRSLMCCLAISAVEFAVGCLVNLKLGWQVWDYSGNAFNIKGQVCVMYSSLWFALSLVLVPLCVEMKKLFHI